MIKHIPQHIHSLFLPDTNAYRAPAMCRYWPRYWGYGLERGRPALSVLGHLCLMTPWVSRGNEMRCTPLRATFRAIQDQPRLFLQPLDFHLLSMSSALPINPLNCPNTPGNFFVLGCAPWPDLPPASRPQLQSNDSGLPHLAPHAVAPP